jgi:ribosomal protein S18 acetylase RimI-like enzyme
LLRKPEPYDIDDCVKLIHISGPNIYDYSMAAKTPRTYEFLRVFYEKPGTMYSKEHVIVAEENGRIGGMVLAYPARISWQFSRNMIKLIKDLLNLGGIFHIAKMMGRMGMNRYYPEPRDDEYFVSNIAVFEEYRGKGLGFKLLKKAEEMALENGLNKLSLNVEIENAHAKRFYEIFGFKEDKKRLMPKKYEKYNLFGFSRMVKEIS